MKKHKNIVLIMACFLLIAAAFLLTSNSMSVPALAQASYQTPTPNADGQIIYTVQEGDTCTRIFLLTGVTIDEIIKLNALGSECGIYPGEKLLIGFVEPSVMTETAQPTATPSNVTPTPTPSPGVAEICIVLFDDVDGNGMRVEGEFYLQGGAVSINNRTGTVSLTGNTVGGDPELLDPLCFSEVPEGDYNISVAVPDGYNATTITNYALTVKAGDQATLDFGAQVGSNISPADEVAAEGGRSPILGIAGLVVLLGGIGLGIYMWRNRQL